VPITHGTGNDRHLWGAVSMASVQLDGSPRAHRFATRALVALALSVVALLAAVSPAFAISRNTVLSRAQTWMDVLVPYSQTTYYHGYRTDCSGYVSMCWKTGMSYSTRSFHSVATSITVDQLEPGDALHKVGHIRLFYGWLDDTHTCYVCYEQTGPTLKSSIRAIADDLAAGYHPCRYEHITNSAPGRNLLRNPAFDVWARPRGSWGAAEPVWWKVDGSEDGTQAVKRQDVSRSGNNSLELVNTSTSPSAYTAMSQIVTVTPETTYAVSAWVRSASDLGALRVSIDYLSPTGALVARVRMYGSSWQIRSDAFRQATFVLASPVDAARAKVVVRLAGGETVVGTQTVPGTSAIVDDIALLRPYSTVTIAKNRSSATIGGKVTLSGALSASPSLVPTVAAGQPYTVYVRKPGSAVWQAWHTHDTFTSAGKAAWKCSYTFKRGMKKGAYRFKVEVPPFGDFLGSTSSTVTVTLR